MRSKLLQKLLSGLTEKASASATVKVKTVIAMRRSERRGRYVASRSMRISQPPTISSVRMRNAKFLPVMYGKKSEGKRGEVTTISGTNGMRKMPTRRQFRRMELRFIGNTLTHFYEVNHYSK